MSQKKISEEKDRYPFRGKARNQSPILLRPALLLADDYRTLNGEDRSATISQDGKAPTRPVQVDRQNGPPLTQTGGTAISRVQNWSNLSVQNVVIRK
jgi:hypothetical protein